MGLTRAADYVLAYPDHTAAVLCVEICSLTMQPEDFSTTNLIASGLFGDGAAAVIVRGSRTVHRSSNGSSQSSRPGPQILGTGSVFYPDTEEIMGWDISESGFKIVLSPQLPELIKGRLAGDIDAFLGKYQLRRADIGNWVIHTGGRLCSCLSRPYCGDFMRRDMFADDAAGGFFNGQFDCIGSLWRWRRCSDCQGGENGPPKLEGLSAILMSWSADPRYRFGVLP